MIVVLSATQCYLQTFEATYLITFFMKCSVPISATEQCSF